MAEEIIKQSDAGAIIEYAKRSTAAELIEVGKNVKVLIASHPNGTRTASSVKGFLDEYRTEPERARGTSYHYTPESFIAHFNKFKNAGSALFASSNTSDPNIVGVYNYNEPGKPAFGDYRAVFQCALADEWKTWVEGSKEFMDQSEFASFIEDNIDDIQPAPDMDRPENKKLKDISLILSYPFASQQQMLQLSRGIEISEGSRAAVKVNLQTGERTIEFANEQNQKVKVPGLFLIKIPVFQNDIPYLLPIRLRYRVNSGSVHWSFDIYRRAAVFKDAYDMICQSIARATGTGVYVGSQEVAAF